MEKNIRWISFTRTSISSTHRPTTTTTTNSRFVQELRRKSSSWHSLLLQTAIQTTTPTVAATIPTTPTTTTNTRTRPILEQGIQKQRIHGCTIPLQLQSQGGTSTFTAMNRPNENLTQWDKATFLLHLHSHPTEEQLDEWIGQLELQYLHSTSSHSTMIDSNTSTTTQPSMTYDPAGESILHTLISYCSKLGTLRGAELAERVLWIAISKQQQQYHHHQEEEEEGEEEGDTQNSNKKKGMDIIHPSDRIMGPTKEMYTMVISAWAQLAKDKNIQRKIRQQEQQQGQVQPQHHHHHHHRHNQQQQQQQPRKEKTNTRMKLPIQYPTKHETMDISNGKSTDSSPLPRNTANTDFVIHPVQRAIQILDFIWEEYNTHLLQDKINNLHSRNTTMDQHMNPTQEGRFVRHFQRLSSLQKDTQSNTRRSNQNHDPIRKTNLDKGNNLILPDYIHYTAVLQALAVSDTYDAPYQAEKLLQQMEDYSGLQDVYIIQTQEKEESIEAQKLISQESSLIQFDKGLIPDRICYNTVLHTWARSKQISWEEKLHHMRNIMKRMEIYHTYFSTIFFVQENQFKLQPNTKSYNFLIMALKNDPISTPTTKKKRLERDSYDQDEYQDVEKKPWIDDKITTTASYVDTNSNYLNYNNDTQIRGKVAENILKEMYAKHQQQNAFTQSYHDNDGDEEDSNSVRPNIKTYNAVIHAWFHSSSIGDSFNSSKGPKRAEHILKALLRNSYLSAPNQDDIDLPIMSDVLPDTVTFNSVITSWARSGSKEAGERADAFLQYMSGNTSLLVKGPSSPSMQDCVVYSKEARMAVGRLHIEPDSITFNAIINAWAHSETPQAASKTENLLNSMLAEYREGNERCMPTVQSFSFSINALAQSQESDRGHRAELLLDRLFELYTEKNDPLWLPSRSCYSGVVAAWTSLSTTREHGAGRKADAAMVRMQTIGGFDPTISEYNSVLASLLSDIEVDSSVCLETVLRCHQLLQEIVKGFEFNSSKAKPNVHSFHYVLRACNYGVSDNNTRRKCFGIALDTFHLMDRSSYGDPDSQTYIQMLKNIQTLLPAQSTERVDIARQFFDRCCEAGLLTNAVLKILYNMLPDSQMRSIESYKEGDDALSVYNLPSTWSCNRRKGQNQKRNRRGMTRKPG